MYAFLRRHWTLFVTLGALLTWQVVFLLWSKSVTAPPLNVPILLSPKGSVETTIRVLVPEVYELNLDFARAGHEYHKLRTLLGDWAHRNGEPVPSGVHVPIRWSLTNEFTNATAASGDVDTFGSIAWSADRVARQVAVVSVPQGHYRFIAEVQRDVPELADIKTRISMRLRPKTSSSWQITLAWWGSLASYFLVWPAIAIVAGLLWQRTVLGSQGRSGG
jgi:uncharacterized protein DUF5625